MTVTRKLPADQRSTGSSSSESSSDTLAEEKWQEMLAKLQKLLKKYDRAKKRGDEEAMKRLATDIEASMRAMADTHPDPAVKAEWTTKADDFGKAPDDAKDNMLLDIGKGLALIVASPFMLAGGVLYGVGLLTKGLGNLFTGGAIGRAMNSK
ncbi:hypothetical protein C8R46DRAFT_1108595 [Mycena filopes]|nr:hypothetical protein C8R46DRAFT_1108595 [Mycena filopes]